MSHSFIHIILSAVILDILQYGHPLLREECGPVVHINRDILSFLDDMQETLAQGGIGLAAPQVGRPIQLVTINIPSTDATTTWLEVDGCPTTLSRIMPLNFINPILHPFGKKVPYREGCLSITKVYANVMRRSCVRAVLTMMDGRTVTVKCNGLLARRTFDRKLELNCRKGLHHLGRQVRKLAEIEGLRHAAVLPDPRQNPNKTSQKSA